jgi:outer membrane protein assembly factor BamB
LNSEGQLLWASAKNRNVYNVATGDVRAEGTPQIVTTSELGRVHIFSAAGANIASLDPGTPATMVRIGKLSESDRTATIFAIGAKPTDQAATVTSLSGDGNVNWSVQLPSNITPPSIYSASLAYGRPWLAVAQQGGQVYVVDAKQGTMIGSIDGQSLLPEVGWIAGKDGAPPRLVISTGTALNGYFVGGK